MRLRILTILTLSMLLHLTVQAEQQPVSAIDSTDRMRNDYITASLLVVSPAAEVYSMFGHCALRLQCPAHRMDYCFTFETSTDTEGMLNFLRGRSMGGFVAAPTDSYLEYYRKEGRSVTQHLLNLTPEEKLRLWQAADKEIALGFTYHYDYLHTQCASMVVGLITSVLPQPVSYGEVPVQVQGSFRDQMLTESEDYPWSRFFWQTFMGPEGDSTEPLEQKLTPRTLPVVWQHVMTDDEPRQLTTAYGDTLVQQTAVGSGWLSVLTPLRACTLFILLVIGITLGQYWLGWQRLPQVIDVTLLALYTLAALLITYLVLFSKLEASQWNWYLPVFNPLPLLLWLVRPCWLSWISCGVLAVIVLTVLMTPFIPQLDGPHALLMGTLAVRLTTRIKKQNNLQ